jgi:nonsense-mediated mRNA decay protein 3
MCDTCAKQRVDISDGITKSAIINYCKLCDRYQRPPWVRSELESPDMMSLCLSKIKGLNKVKVVDTGFVWTEPHSKMIKVKITIQKEYNKSILQATFVTEFRIDWTQCDDCKKLFTPHIWNASCQVRQKVSHKRTFMLLEQIILKHKAHSKALNVKEMAEGMDFYFSHKSHAASLAEFIHSVLPCKVKQSKTLVSHDQFSNLYNYKYTYMIELAPVCKDDLIIIDKDTSKELGGVGPLFLCNKLSTNIHLIDPFTMETFEFDDNTYWKYNFRSYVDRSCFEEFIIVSVEEDIDYSKYKYIANNTNTDVQMSDVSHSKTINSKSTNYKLIKDNEKKERQGRERLPHVNVTVICANKPSDPITVKCHLEKVKEGDIYYGNLILT